VPPQLQRPDDAAVEGSAVCERRTAVARRDVGRDRATSDPLGAFEHQRSKARFREERGGDEPVVPAANDDHFAHGSG
jgi:hypothetical protein